jgi:hypothetical protein
MVLWPELARTSPAQSRVWPTRTWVSGGARPRCVVITRRYGAAAAGCYLKKYE